MAVTITEGDILFDGGPTKFQEPSEAGIFADYMINSRYEHSGRTYMLGLTSPGGFQNSFAAFVQLAAPTLLWIVDWTASRLNTQPEFPDPNPRDLNWVLLDKVFEPVMVTVGPDGVTPLYRISGTYFYGHRRPNNATLPNLSFPKPPWLQDAFNREVPAAKAKRDLLDRGSNLGMFIQG